MYRELLLSLFLLRVPSHLCRVRDKIIRKIEFYNGG